MPGSRRPRPRLLAAAAAALLVLLPGACASSGGAVSPPGAHKVLVIVEENHSRAEALAQMPHLQAWAQTYGQATAYHGVAHPSLPNYLAIGAGSTFGITDDQPPSAHPIAGQSVLDQTIAAGKTARVYAESMPGNCALDSAGTYAVKHNAWAYLDGSTERVNCQRHDVPLGTTASGPLLDDIQAGTLPVTGEIVPNLCDDAHDCSLATADDWLATWVPVILAGPDYRAGNLTVIVTFDEDDRQAGNNVALVVIDPRLHGRVVTLASNHYSLTRWLDRNAGVPLLRHAGTAPGLKAAFGL